MTSLSLLCYHTQISAYNRVYISIISRPCSLKKKNTIHVSGRWELPWWLRWYRICLQCRRPGFNSWVRKILWRREWQPTPVFLPGESHRQRSLVSCSPWGRRESDVAEWLTLSLFCLSNVGHLCPLSRFLSIISENIHRLSLQLAVQGMNDYILKNWSDLIIRWIKSRLVC